MTRTLLDKAKAAKPLKRLHLPIRAGELELSLAYCRGEITLVQYWAGLGRAARSNGSATHRIGSVIRDGIMRGYLQVKIIRKKNRL